MNKYDEWIENWLNDNDPYNKCEETTKEMLLIFPELKRVRGHVITIDYGINYPRPHWWLKDNQDNIIDPTVSQWRGIIEYQPYDESLGEPTGKCANCGELCYNGGTCCSDKCNKEYVEYINSSGVF